MKNEIFAGLAVLFAGAAVLSLHNKVDSISDQVERVKVESIVSSGKAIYMPGNVCVLKATSEIDSKKMREFAAACVKSHENWLLINDEKTSYIYEDTAIQAQ